MAVSLQKATRGQKISLEKSMRLALIGLGWKSNKYKGGYDFDLDASAFLLGPDGTCMQDQDFVFYGNPSARNGAVFSKGDDQSGGDEDDEGDQEQIVVNFNKLPPQIEKIAITVTIYDAEARGQNFGQVSDAYVRMAKIQKEDDENGETVIEYNLEEDFSNETALVACEIVKQGSDWKFNAVGQGFEGGLAALCANYGIDAS